MKITIHPGLFRIAKKKALPHSEYHSEQSLQLSENQEVGILANRSPLTITGNFRRRKKTIPSFNSKYYENRSHSFEVNNPTIREDSYRQPIHSRKTQRFKMLSRNKRKYQANNSKSCESNRLQFFKIQKEFIQSFNEYSVNFIRKVQEQSVNNVKQKWKRKVDCNKARRQEKHKVLSKAETYRPWSRMKFEEEGEAGDFML